MSKRYSYRERIKIEYYKCKIKELIYLEYETNRLNDELDSALYYINRNNPVIYISKDKSIQSKQSDKWNKMIIEKDIISNKLRSLKNEISYIESILNALSPLTKNIAIDLFVRKFSSEKIKNKYYVSNPYQTINDELRYLEIDKF